MAAGAGTAAAASASASAAVPSSWASIVDQSHASSSGCSCCLCRHSCQCCESGHGAAGLCEDKARLAAALIAARTSDRSTAVASLVLFAVSVGVILAKLGASSSSSSSKAIDRRARDRKDRFFVKRSRKPRWEWRPVTRRSTASQTLPPLEIVEASSQVPETMIDSSTEFPELSRTVAEKSTMIDSLVEFPELSLVEFYHPVESSPPPPPPPPPPRSSEDVKDLVAKLSPVPMVELLRTDSMIRDDGASTSKAFVIVDGDEEQHRHSPSPAQEQGHPSSTPVQAPSTPPQEPEEQHHLNRKQRKHLKKKQKKLVAASRTFQISSLPVLKQWKSSSSPSPPPFRKLDLTPCKIYDCAASNKPFGPLGSPSSKSIAWTFSASPKPSAAAAAAAGLLVPSAVSSSTPPPTGSGSDHAAKAVVQPEMSEISESPKSYLGDWTDSESFKRSSSDPEEIELDVPSLDLEFEDDSEDYNFQPSASTPSH